jgi:hypothetical protein
MMTTIRKFKVACVQATPVIFDLEKSVEKVIILTANAAGHYSRNDIFELKVKDQPGIRTN